MTKRRRKTTRRRRMPSRSIKSMWKNTKHRKKKLAAALAALALLDIHAFKYRELKEYKKQTEEGKQLEMHNIVERIIALDKPVKNVPGRWGKFF